MPNFVQYVQHGWSLCSIERGRKFPTYKGWEERGITKGEARIAVGAGLLHALSGTCALDVDYQPQATVWLAERGIDLDALLRADNAVQITSGRPNRAKLLYNLSTLLRTLKPTGQGLELRCATVEGESVQDVLPGSIHPDTGEPYRWQLGLVGDWRALPPIPPKLLAAWRAETERITVKKPKRHKPTLKYPELTDLLRRKSPDAGYDQWVKIGMAIHHETSGSDEGLDIWDDWSSRSSKYKGIEDLQSHWGSFQSTKGKRIVTGGSLRQEDVAEADDFDEVIPNEEDEVEALKEQKKSKRGQAEEKLKELLVYVQQSEKYFRLDTHRVLTTDNTIEHQLTSLMPKKNGVHLNPVKILKQMADKPMVSALGFDPGSGSVFEHQGDLFANQYKPVEITPLKPNREDRKRIEWLLDLTKPDPVFRAYLPQFYGHVVQFPGVKINSAPLIWSETEGNGKTTLLKKIPALLVGGKYSREVSQDLLASNFNDYLTGAWHVNLPEFHANSRGERTAITAKLKPWITDSVITIHPKGQRGYDMPNHFFVTASSNRDDAAMLNNEDRRWAVHELKAPPMTLEQQRWIYDEFLLTERAAGVLLYYFLHVDLTGFDPSAKAPITASRQDMVNASTSVEKQLLVDAYEAREDFFARDIVVTSDITTLIRKHTQFKNISAYSVGRMLTKPPFNGTAKQWRSGKGTKRGVILFNVEKWSHASGKVIEDHIEGGTDDDISDDTIEKDPLLG